MNAALAVFRLELKERSRVFIVALALAVLPFAVSAIPSLAGQRSYAIAAIGIWGALIYGLAVAFVTGASTLGRALAEKRMSFYLVRPISPAALWFGKLLGGLAVCFTAAAIIAIPVVIVAPDPARQHVGLIGDGLGIVLLAGVPALFLIGNVASTFARSRSIRVAFDFVCLLIAGTAVVFIARGPIVGGAIEATGWVLVSALVAVLLLMTIAPVWQIARGRGVMKESHAALSNALWAGVTVIVLALAGWAAWVTNAPFESIRVYGFGAQSADGEWTIVGGETRRAGFHTAYLVNTKTREKVRRDALPWSGAEISGDGRTLVTAGLAELFPKTGATEFVFSPLRSGGVAGVVRTSEWTGRYALSADASMLVTVSSTGLTAWDPASGNMLAASRVDGRNVASLFFVAPQIVRVITRSRGLDELEIHEFDIAQRTIRRTGAFRAPGAFVIASGDGERLLLLSEDRVIHGRTGETLMQLPDGDNVLGTMLRDGRVATVTRGGERAILQVYDADGVAQEAIELPAPRARFVGQVGDSKLMLSLVRGGLGLVIVDLERASIVTTIEGAQTTPSYVDQRLIQFTDDGLVVALDAEKKLAAWEIATGKKRDL